MIEYLNRIDTQLFLALNGHYSPFADLLMYNVSKTLPWIPWYACIIYLLFRKYHKPAVWMVVSLVLVVLLADQGTVVLFKNVFQRLRPSHQPALEGLVHLVKDKRGGDYGFISSHAANTFGVALLASMFYKDKYFCAIAFTWALLVSYSRIYLGMHYPGDILCGWLFGAAVAYLVYTLFIYAIKRKLPLFYDHFTKV